MHHFRGNRNNSIPVFVSTITSQQLPSYLSFRKKPTIETWLKFNFSFGEKKLYPVGIHLSTTYPPNPLPEFSYGVNSAFVSFCLKSRV